MESPPLPPMAISLLFGVLACLLALAAGHPFVRLLRLYRVGKAIQLELPDSHSAKAGGRSLQEPHGLPLSTRRRRGSPQRANALRTCCCTAASGTCAHW